MSPERDVAAIRRGTHGSGPIAWFAANPVAANLLMVLILLGGVGGLYLMQKEVFPRFASNQVDVHASYPGAGPVEIETSVCIPIEEALHDLPEVRNLSSVATEGECTVSVETPADGDDDQIANAVRARIQALPRLPKGVERIDVRPAGPEGDDGVIWVALHGPTDPLTLKRLGDRIQSELARIPGVSRARNYNDIPYEIAIEVPSGRLRQHGLSLNEVADAVRRNSLNVSGGLVKNPMGEILLRVQGEAGDAAALGNLVLRTNPGGSRLLLRDVAVIKDGLEERFSEWHHNGETAQGWEIHADRDTVGVARRVKVFVDGMRKDLPAGIVLITWWDDSQSFDERIDTLIEDGVSGFLLVCAVLTLFLSARVAIWAAVGIFTSVFGTLAVMALTGISLNMLSLFGFLLAMGILVDDAIIIGEGVYTRQKESGASADGPDRRGRCLAATIDAVNDLALPVSLAVLIVLVAFLPGLFLPGWAGQMMRPICIVMILTLVFSLIEALLILPAHLAPPPAPPRDTVLVRCRDALNRGVECFVARIYGPLLEAALRWRYLTAAVFAALLIISAALVEGGVVRVSLQADVTKNSFWVSLSLPKDAPYAETQAAAAKIEKALLTVREEWDRRLGVGSSVIVGLETLVWEHGAGFWTELSPEGRQRVPVEAFVADWRRQIGDLGRARIDFLYKEGDSPADLQFDFRAEDTILLTRATEEFKRLLRTYPGVSDVTDSSEKGNPEVRLRLKPEAERLGLRLEELAQQVHGAYYGEEVHRIQRGTREVKLMVRLPRGERQSLESLRALPVRLPGGGIAPLGSLADLTMVPGYARIVRQNRQRIITVEARVDAQLADAGAIYEDIEQKQLPRLKQRFQGMGLASGEARQEEGASASVLAVGTGLALVVIYALIAVPFRSYTQPLIFLIAAPVAWSGAVLAHWLVGLPLSMESLVGMIAASGVVINDSLVLLDYIRERGHDNVPLVQLIGDACRSRFRPIMLAFLTNFAGFLPTLMETSEQAQFLLPMTLSLSAGLLIGMAASLVLTPVCYAILGAIHEPVHRVGVAPVD